MYASLHCSRGSDWLFDAGVSYVLGQWPQRFLRMQIKRSRQKPSSIGEISASSGMIKRLAITSKIPRIMVAASPMPAKNKLKANAAQMISPIALKIVNPNPVLAPIKPMAAKMPMGRKK